MSCRSLDSLAPIVLGAVLVAAGSAAPAAAAEKQPERITQGSGPAAIALAGVGMPGPSIAQCSYPFLGSGSSVNYSAGTVLYPTIVQSTNYWSAVAIQPDAGTDWDLAINQTATSFPACVTNQLASSVRAGSAVDVVIGDFNHNAFGSYYVQPYLYSGTGNARIEWDDGSDQFGVNALRIQRSTGPTDVIECWDIYVESGRNYIFSSQILGGANMKLLLFKNPAAAPYWANRNAAYYEIDLPPHSSPEAGSCSGWPPVRRSRSTSSTPRVGASRNSSRARASRDTGASSGPGPAATGGGWRPASTSCGCASTDARSRTRGSCSCRDQLRARASRERKTSSANASGAA